MKVVNKIEIKLENFEKCCVICDTDCSLGQLYDFSCSLQAFIIEKMNACNESQVSKKQEIDFSNQEIKQE